MNSLETHSISLCSYEICQVLCHAEVVKETLKYGSKGRNLLAYSDRGEQAIRQGDSEIAEVWFNQAAEYWKQAIALNPGNHIEAYNWLKITRRFK
ncbi:Photosystem I assembly protein Ycf3, partial [Cucurbita argyrosperma subsp. sororia]